MRSLESIKGFGPVRLKALAARGIETALDLVETLPTGYKDTTRPLSPAQMTEGRQACFTGFVKGKPALHYARGMRWVSATIADECGAVRCMWFNQPWMKERLFDTCEVTLYGRCVRKKSGLFVINPSLEEPGSIIPVYAAVPGVGQKPLRDAVKLLLDDQGQPTQAARMWADRFEEVQVDEYQDTNRRILTGWRRLRSGWPTRSCCSFRRAWPGQRGSAGARSRWRFRMHG